MGFEPQRLREGRFFTLNRSWIRGTFHGGHSVPRESLLGDLDKRLLGEAVWSWSFQREEAPVLFKDSSSIALCQPRIEVV